MLSAALLTLLEIPLGNFHKCILYLFVLLLWREEKPLFSNAQKANCNAETVTTFSRRGCSIWNALSLTLGVFKDFCLDACSAHQQVWSGPQVADRKPRHTQWLSPREKSCLAALLWQKPAQKYLCFPACIFCLCCYRAFQWYKKQCRCPVHFPSYLLCWLLWLKPPHAWTKQEGWSTGSFSYSTQKLWEGLEKNPFPVPTPRAVCLLLVSNTTCSLLEEPPLFTSCPSLHKKPFFFFLWVPFLEAVRRERAGSPNNECWRLHDQQQQELQFPVSEVLAMSTITVNTLFGYSNCQNFKPSSIELVPLHKLIIQSYWINSHMDGKIHV